MCTKIDLEYPYNVKWKSGYLVTNRENRKTLLLFNSKDDRSSTQYARYLLAVKLKRFLTEQETVDHIDSDKTNDDISNLQLMSRLDNLLKSSKQPDVELTCPVCKIVFHRSLTQLRGRKDRIEKGGVTCSRTCGGTLGHLTKRK